MSFEDMDLNIDNYSLNDLLELFNIPFDFDEEHLKQVKTVLRHILIKWVRQRNIFIFAKPTSQYILFIILGLGQKKILVLIEVIRQGDR